MSDPLSFLMLMLLAAMLVMAFLGVRDIGRRLIDMAAARPDATPDNFDCNTTKFLHSAG